MHVIFSQFSGLVGLLILLNQLWRYASLENAVMAAAGSAMGVYVILLAGDYMIRRIITFRPPQPATAGRVKRSSDQQYSTHSHNLSAERVPSPEAEGVPAA